jgi:riboflavin biosynthesis pyrimidine reductase
MLTARGVRVRRIARRIIIDPYLRVSPSAKVVLTANQIPTTFYCCDDMAESGPRGDIDRYGGEVIGMPHENGEMSLREVFIDLMKRYGASNVLAEGGTGLLSRLFKQKLVNQAWVFTAPMLLGDEQAKPAVSNVVARSLGDGFKFKLVAMQRRGDDVCAQYRILD